MEENVTVELCDLLTTTDQVSSESTELCHLFKLLRSKLMEPSGIPFSMKFEQVYEFKKSDIMGLDQSYIGFYNIEVVSEMNLMIVGGVGTLYFIDLTSRTVKQTVLLKKVPNIYHILVEGEYLYLTTAVHLNKYKLKLLLKGEGKKSLIWRSSIAGTAVTKFWGFAIKKINDKEFAFVMNERNGIYVFDTKTGKQHVGMKFPNIKSTMLAFTEENEMIISSLEFNSSESPLQLLTFDKETQTWTKLRETERRDGFGAPFGVFYERNTQLIYLADPKVRKVFVFNKRTMDVIYEWDLGMKWLGRTMFSVTIDPKTGLLYLGFSDHSVQILK